MPMAAPVWAVYGWHDVIFPFYNKKTETSRSGKLQEREVFLVFGNIVF